MPLLATFAGASARGLGFQAGVEIGDFEPIASQTLTGTATSVTFSSIPQNYKHLQIRAIHQEPSDTVALQFNGVTSNVYLSHWIYGDGGAVFSGYLSPSQLYFGTNYGSSGSNFGASVCDILDYTNTNKYTTIRSISGAENNTAFGRAYLFSGAWLNSAAVTSILIKGRTGGNLAIGSSFALYGIKG